MDHSQSSEIVLAALTSLHAFRLTVSPCAFGPVHTHKAGRAGVNPGKVSNNFVGTTPLIHKPVSMPEVMSKARVESFCPWIKEAHSSQATMTVDSGYTVLLGLKTFVQGTTIKLRMHTRLLEALHQRHLFCAGWKMARYRWMKLEQTMVPPACSHLYRFSGDGSLLQDSNTVLIVALQLWLLKVSAASSLQTWKDCLRCTWSLTTNNVIVSNHYQWAACEVRG